MHSPKRRKIHTGSVHSIWPRDSVGMAAPYSAPVARADRSRKIYYVIGIAILLPVNALGLAYLYQHFGAAKTASANVPLRSPNPAVGWAAPPRADAVPAEMLPGGSTPSSILPMKPEDETTTAVNQALTKVPHKGAEPEGSVACIGGYAMAVNSTKTYVAQILVNDDPVVCR